MKNKENVKLNLYIAFLFKMELALRDFSNSEGRYYTTAEGLANEMLKSIKEFEGQIKAGG